MTRAHTIEREAGSLASGIATAKADLGEGLL